MMYGEEFVQASGWGGRRVLTEKPRRLDADMPDGTSSIVNRATQELWVRSKYEMIGLDWCDLRAYLIKHCSQYDASQVLYTMKTQGKLLRVYITDQGVKDVQWREDLVRDRESYFEKLNIEDAKSYFSELSEDEITQGTYLEDAASNLSARAQIHLNELVKAAKKRISSDVVAKNTESLEGQFDDLCVNDEK